MNNAPSVGVAFKTRRELLNFPALLSAKLRNQLWKLFLDPSVAATAKVKPEAARHHDLDE